MKNRIRINARIRLIGFNLNLIKEIRARYNFLNPRYKPIMHRITFSAITPERLDGFLIFLRRFVELSESFPTVCHTP